MDSDDKLYAIGFGGMFVAIIVLIAFLAVAHAFGNDRYRCTQACADTGVLRHTQASTTAPDTCECRP